MGWAAGFSAGGQMGSRIVDTYRQSKDYQDKEKRKEEIAALLGQKEAPAYTAGQGQELGAIAGALKPDGTPYYDVAADANGGYTVNPNFQNETGTQPQAYTPSTLAAKGVSFLGKNYEAPLNAEQTTAAQQQAIAGVMERGGDTEGAMRYRQQARAGQLVDMQIADAGTARERRVVTDGQADTRFANDQTTFARTSKDAERNSQLAQEQAQREGAFREVVGKFTQGKWAAIPEIYKGYNDGHSATVKEDGKGGATVQLFDGDGKPVGQQHFKNELEFITGAIAKMDPKLWVSKVESQESAAQAQRNWDRTSDRADQSLGLQQAQLGLSRASHNASNADRTASREDRAALRAASVDYETARQTGDEAGMRAATLKLIQAGGTAPGGANANDPSEVKLANAYIRAGLASNLAEGLQLATSSKDASPDRVRAEVYGKALAANFGNADRAKEATESAMQYLFPPGSKVGRSSAGKVTDAVATFKDQGEADAAVKSGKLKPGDKVSIGGRTATWR